MNRVHNVLCSSGWWSRRVEHELVPWGVEGVELVLCFTMLHHVPTPAQQDRAFAEIARVLRAGGTFAGTDSIGAGWLFHSIHIGDTLNLIDPDTLAARLQAAGLAVGEVKRGGRSFRWRATKPGAL